MITEEKINGKVFISQTTYYVYNNEEDFKDGKHSLCTSDAGIFKEMKKHACKIERTNKVE